MLNQCGVVIETLTLLALQRGSLAHWVASRNVEIVHPSMHPVVSSGKTLYPYCLVLVGSRNGFENDSPIELK